MNPRRTWILVILAMGVLGFILAFERRLPGPDEVRSAPPKMFPQYDFNAVNAITLLLGTNQVILADQANWVWTMSEPNRYPAHAMRIDALLRTLAALTRQHHVSAQDALSQSNGLAAFGLDPPRTVIVVQRASNRVELRLGSKTADGSQVYYQVLGVEGVFATSDNLFDAIPRTPEDWRDDNLIRVADREINRLEVRAGPPSGFAVQQETSSRLWRLVKPTPARADTTRLDFLVNQLTHWTITQFVTDNPKADLEPYGLQSPLVELVLGRGTNDLAVIEFGKSPTNDPSLVYARCSSQSNVVLVARELLGSLTAPYTEYRDRRLVSFPASAIERIEVQAEGVFSLQRQTNGTWNGVASTNFVADPEEMKEFLNNLVSLEVVEFGNDVVTDFVSYGLAPPKRRYTLVAVYPESAVHLTNQIDFGSNLADRVYVRRTDESSINFVKVSDYYRLPDKAIDLRDRDIWHFTSNQVRQATVLLKDQTCKVTRTGGNWVLSSSAQPIASPLAAEWEEILYRLGRLRAEAWVDQGQDKLERYGIVESAHQLSLEVEIDGKPQVLRLDFGRMSPAHLPLAAVTVDGQSLVFEFSLALYQLYLDFLRNVSAPGPGP
jgi:hypothetical protein